VVNNDKLIGTTEYDTINQVTHKLMSLKLVLTVCVLCYSNMPKTEFSVPYIEILPSVPS